MQKCILRLTKKYLTISISIIKKVYLNTLIVLMLIRKNLFLSKKNVFMWAKMINESISDWMLHEAHCHSFDMPSRYEMCAAVPRTRAGSSSFSSPFIAGSRAYLCLLSAYRNWIACLVVILTCIWMSLRHANLLRLSSNYNAHSGRHKRSYSAYHISCFSLRVSFFQSAQWAVPRYNFQYRSV